MTHAEARRAFSIIVDVARSKDALMNHLRSRHAPDAATIWGAEEGDLHLVNVGSHDRPDYELEWETGTMPRAIESRRTDSRIIATLDVENDEGLLRRISST